jgi:hypothetical protein
MKRMMLTGAITGFACGFGFGWAREAPLENAFFHACVAAYVAGMLMRWWGGVWVRSLRESYEERSAAAAVAENQQETPLASERS